ncbi:MAG TPA: cyclase family protein [Vicinamibacteria bacterium]|nr:cyclase family protein [Vicinamibacteria bacterium]
MTSRPRPGSHDLRAMALVAGLAVGIAPAEGAAPSAPPSAPDLRTARVVDLSHPFDERTLYWPTAPSGFKLERLHFGQTDGGFFYSAYAFCAPEHGGTHLDAPIHFGEGRWPVDQVPVDRLVRPAIVIDVAAAADADADHRLSVDELRTWEARHGRIPEGAMVLLRTGWSARWPDKKRYLGDDTPGDASHLHFPSYGADAARILVADRKVTALGVDTASIDHGPSKDFPVHQIVAAANVLGLENLTGLDALPPTGAWVIALPMKIAGGSGGPLRAIALVP